jgi:hypothetical protein
VWQKGEQGQRHQQQFNRLILLDVILVGGSVAAAQQCSKGDNDNTIGNNKNLVNGHSIQLMMGTKE